MWSGYCASGTNVKPAIVTDRVCRICGNTEGNQSFFPKEMMFGWREAFEYLECARCGCLQIAEVPENLARYYPSDGYYSYKAPKQKRYPGWLLIVDIGCGAGGLLPLLQREGFRSLLGADPFIQADIDYGNGVRILKRGVEELDGQFDFVMLHHSFEHVPDPARTLNALRQRLAPGGTLLLRMPVADSYARRNYGLHWQAWEAPRHLHLHTSRSMDLLAAAAGLAVAQIVFDSEGQRLSSSELYIRGVPYVEHGKYRPGGRADAFTHAQWDNFQAQAAELNRKGEGDTACFYLRAR